MTTPIRLDQAYTAILTAYEGYLNEATATGSLLEDVNTVIRADQTRPKPSTPAIWIFPQPAMQNQTFARRETWELPVQLTAIVKEKDPLIGYNKAFELSAKARSVILSNRNLGLAYVRDTISKSFSFGKPTDNKLKNLHYHDAIVVTRFEVLE